MSFDSSRYFQKRLVYSLFSLFYFCPRKFSRCFILFQAHMNCFYFITGKKSKKTKGKPVPLAEFLGESNPAGGSAVVVNKSSWAEESEDNEGELTLVILSLLLTHLLQEA